MTTSGKLANNTILVLTSRSIEVLSGLITVGLLARYLGVREFGEYAFIMALVWTVLPILSTGIPRILVREIAQQKESAERHVNDGLTLNSIMILALLPVLLLYTLTLDTKEAASCLFAFLIVAFMTLTQTLNALFAAFGRFLYETATSLATMMSLMLFILAVVYFDLGFISIFAATTAAYLTGLITSRTLSHRLTGFRPKAVLQFSGLQYLFKESMPLAFFQLLLQLFIYTGIFVLKAFAGSTDVALYQAPLKIFTGFMIIPISLMAPLLPILSQKASADGSTEELIQTASAMFKFLLILSTLLTLAGVTLSGWVIPLVYGEAFARSISGLKILLLGASFFFLNTFYVTLAIASGRQKSIVFVQAAGLAICILLNLALVPALGYRGSTIALTASSGFIFAVYCFLFRDVIQKKFLARTGSILVMGFVLTGALQLLPPAISILYSLPFGMSFFVAGLFGFRLLSTRELAPMAGLLRKRRLAAIKE